MLVDHPRNIPTTLERSQGTMPRTHHRLTDDKGNSGCLICFVGRVVMGLRLFTIVDICRIIIIINDDDRQVFFVSNAVHRVN